MDSRDIKEEPRKIEQGKYLEDIYGLQKVLLDHYINIEGLPQFPIDVNTKANQVMLKDFTSRIIEELAEGYESFEELIERLKATNFNVLMLSSDTLKVALQNFNEELSDALHFFIELLIYANVQPDDILRYYRKFTPLHSEDDNDSGDVINIIGKGPELIGSKFESNDYTHDKHKFSVLNNPDKLHTIGNSFTLGSDIEPNNKLSLYLWEITYKLNMSRNCLKNKPWKQSGVMTDEIKYQAYLVEAFIYFIKTLFAFGADSEVIHYIYFKKNMVNRFRIESKY